MQSTGDPNARLTTLEALMLFQEKYWESEKARYIKEAREAGRPPPALDANSAHLAICRHLQSEAEELVRCGNWKIHQQTKLADVRSITYECVDVAKFLFTLLAIHGISAADFVQAFYEKSVAVKYRRNLEIVRHRAALGLLGPSLICDLDGVVCARDTALLGFAKQQGYGEWRATADMKRALGQATYEKVKDAFYLSGGFVTALPVVAPITTLRMARNLAIPILLVTARDIKRFPTIEIDTYQWLERNEVPFDAVLFSSEKERAVAGLVTPDSIAIDDEEVNVTRLKHVCEAHLYFMNTPLYDAVHTLAARRVSVEKA